MFGKKRAQVLNQRGVYVFVAEAGRYKGLVKNLEWPRGLSLQLSADCPGIFAPGPELPTERMKEHHPLGFGRQCSVAREQRQHRKNNNDGRRMSALAVSHRPCQSQDILTRLGFDASPLLGVLTSLCWPAKDLKRCPLRLHCWRRSRYRWEN